MITLRAAILLYSSRRLTICGLIGPGGAVFDGWRTASWAMCIARALWFWEGGKVISSEGIDIMGYGDVCESSRCHA
ncbi:MAG: hypothetical protein ACP6IU_12560 [Candidatus Asgardarchaeia archaeon]